MTVLINTLINLQLHNIQKGFPAFSVTFCSFLTSFENISPLHIKLFNMFCHCNNKACENKFHFYTVCHFISRIAFETK